MISYDDDELELVLRFRLFNLQWLAVGSIPAWDKNLLFYQINSADIFWENSVLTATLRNILWRYGRNQCDWRDVKTAHTKLQYDIS